MVAYSLRPHVIASWNSYCYKEFIISGIDIKEVMVEDWLSLTNAQVQEILVESARPRTRELSSHELVLFLCSRGRIRVRRIRVKTVCWSKLLG